jgi:16S rRNA G966 N2-methylase RsmD
MKQSMKKIIVTKSRNINGLKKIMFPPICNDLLSSVMIDNDSIKFITYHSTAEIMTKNLIDCLTNYPCPPEIKLDEWTGYTSKQKCSHLVITEMTAGVGGNVLNFAKYFKYINAIEINKARFDYLNINVKLYSLQNVNTYNVDSMKLLIEQNELIQDIIFFDPPWGGKDYKSHTSMRLSFMDISIEDICIKLFQKNRIKIIVLKLPNNYDFDFFKEELKLYDIVKYTLDRLTMIVIKNFT